MKCEKCGTDLPYDAVACYRCGTVTDATFVRASPQVPTAAKMGIVIGTGAIIAIVSAVAIALIVGIGLFVFILNERNESRRKSDQIESARKDAEAAKQQVDELKRQQQERDQRQQEQPQNVPPPQTEPPPIKAPTPDARIINISADNIGLKGWWQPFNVPKGGGMLTGRLEGEGGMRGEFNVYVVTDEQLTDFRNGKSAQTFYTKQGLTVHDVKVSLPAGNYYILLQSGSGWTGRQVTGKLRIDK